MKSLILSLLAGLACACGGAPEDLRDLGQAEQDLSSASVPVSGTGGGKWVHGGVVKTQGTQQMLQACRTNSGSNQFNCGSFFIYEPVNAFAQQLCVPSNTLRPYVSAAVQQLLIEGIGAVALPHASCASGDSRIDVGTTPNPGISGFDTRNYSTGGCVSANSPHSASFGGQSYNLIGCNKYSYQIDLARIAPLGGIALQMVANNVVLQLAGIGARPCFGGTCTGNASRTNYSSVPSSVPYNTMVTSGENCRSQSWDQIGFGQDPTSLFSSGCANN